MERRLGKARLMISMVYMGDCWKQRNKIIGMNTQGRRVTGRVIPEMIPAERDKHYQSCRVGVSRCIGSGSTPLAMPAA